MSIADVSSTVIAASSRGMILEDLTYGELRPLLRGRRRRGLAHDGRRD
jgi:hypothetical protein